MTEPREREFHAAGEAEMMALGATLAGELAGGQVITLSGELGAGKTTLVRGMLRGLGFEGRVKSPSYGLVESYEVSGLDIHHLDLYRLGEPEELDFIGIENLIGPDSVLLIEWPERGRGRLPDASARIRIEDFGTGRRVRLESLI
ncbi:MAG TPA: tRNA (adenosine(37)-N6)-threonylcarbamoyltransferase complex ATPase subunit type 1 TsaE [Wenzhouxiangellaceae bacterium]|nr:tRNA (adenosine(37)-N6)-threonylcarbamoyltransferase complex ATPase subunit type 1 TsaE [Wenzhouxiangellaceae bacterium]